MVKHMDMVDISILTALSSLKKDSGTETYLKAMEPNNTQMDPNLPESSSKERNKATACTNRTMALNILEAGNRTIKKVKA